MLVFKHIVDLAANKVEKRGIEQNLTATLDVTEQRRLTSELAVANKAIDNIIHNEAPKRRISLAQGQRTITDPEIVHRRPCLAGE